MSGAGLILDFAVFIALHKSLVQAFYANCISSAVGLCFVFLVSTKKIFRVDGAFLFPMFWAYLAYQICGTLICSQIISALHHSGLGLTAPVAKVAILPATFLANYFFMSWLTSRKRTWVAVKTNTEPSQQERVYGD